VDADVLQRVFHMRTNGMTRTWNRVVLASRCWCQACAATSARAMGARQPVPRESAY